MPQQREPQSSQRFPTRLTALSVAIFGLLATPHAFAQESTSQSEASNTGTTETLDPVVITGERGNDTNIVVRSKRIELEQAVNLEDIFKQTPEVNVAGGQATAQKLYIRGINERMLHITVDGAAQPEAAYHHAGQALIEPDLLKRVEVETGTGAATAGPGALAGAIRFTTKNADDLLRNGEIAGAIVKTGYQSASKNIVYSLTGFGKLSDQFGIVASMHGINGDDYKDGHGNTVANSAAKTRDYFVKLNNDMGNGHSFELSHEHYQDSGTRNKRTNLLPATFNASQKQKMERDSTVLNYRYDNGNPYVNLKFTGYINKNTTWLGLGTSSLEKLGIKSEGLDLSNTSQLGKHALTYGINYRQDTGFSTVAGEKLADDKASVFGAFVQDDWRLTDHWALTTGLRYDRYNYTDMLGKNFKSDGFSPSTSLAWMPNDQWTFRLSHARALRGVGVIEPFLKAYQENADDLKAEKANNTELSAQWKKGNWHVSATVFDQKIKNYIDYDDYRQNMGTLTSKGYSASIGYDADRWSYSIGVTHSKPKLNGEALSDSNALLLGNSTGRTWVSQLDYDIPKYHVKLGWTARFAERLEGATTTQSKPGYGVHDLYAQWNPDGKENLTLSFAIKNIFDKYYLDQASFGYHSRWRTVAGLPETGRDFRVTLAYRF